VSAGAVAWLLLAVWFAVLVVAWVRCLLGDEAEQRVLDERCRQRIEQRRLIDEATAVADARTKDEER
jgi:hypothetical protein